VWRRMLTGESYCADICFTMVEMYETSFAPADVPYNVTAHTELRACIDAQLGKVTAMRGEPQHSLLVRPCCTAPSAMSPVAEYSAAEQ
jgi:hypothetical protein